MLSTWMSGTKPRSLRRIGGVWWKAKRGRDLFRPYELQALDALRGALTPEAAALLDGQIAGKQLVQRLYGDAEVNTYPNRRGPQRHDPATAFPNRSPDLRLATVQLRGPTGTGKVVVHAVNGHLFQLRFSPRPATLGPAAEITVTKATIHADPMAPDAGATTRDYLERIDPGVRAELEDVWARPETAAGLAKPDELYSIDLDDGAWLVLAQLDDTSFLVARLDPPGPGFRRFEPDGEIIADYDHLGDAFTARPRG
jgi:hypothetical protein